MLNKLADQKTISRYIGRFRSMSISHQIFIFYIFFLLIYTCVLFALKWNQVWDLLDIQIDKNYHSEVIIQKLNKQREIKSLLDTLNTINTNTLYTKQLLFLSIYSQELINKDLISTPSNFDFSKLSQVKSMNLYSEISPQFRLTSPLESIVKPDAPITNKLVPLYYNICPLLYQHLHVNGIDLESFYYISNSNLNPEIGVYFKYPVTEIKVNTGGINSNIYYYNTLLDPMTKALESETNKNVIKDNWYYIQSEKYLTSRKNSELGLFTISDVNHEFNNEEYLYSYLFTTIKYDGKDYVLSFIQAFDEKNLNLPYIHSNNNDWWTIINTRNNNKDDVIITHTPEIIDNLYHYSLFTKDDNYLYQNSSWNFNDFANLSDKYDINYFYSKDALVFPIFDFINKFLNTGKCAIHDLNEYYAQIFDEYDCKNEFCFYRNCTHDSLILLDQFQSYKYNFQPSCMCLPFYCIDDEIISYPKQLESLNTEENREKYFISSKKNYKGNTEFYDPKYPMLQCKLGWNMKNANYTTSYFYMKTMNFRAPYNYDLTNTVYSWFDDYEYKKDILENFKSLTDKFVWKVILLYFIGVTILIIVVIIVLYIKVQNLIIRIMSIRKIIPKIIESSNDNFKWKKGNIPKKGAETQSIQHSPSDIVSNNQDNPIIPSLKIKQTNKNYDTLEDDGRLILETSHKRKHISDNARSVSFHRAFGWEEKEDKWIPLFNDELQDLLYLVYEQRKEFKISFDIDEKMQGENVLINKMYYILKAKNPENTDLSISIFNELLTCEGFVDFNTFRPNIYYKKKSGKTLLEDVNVNELQSEGVNFINEVTDGDKIRNALGFYIEKIWLPLTMEEEGRK